MNFEEWFEKEMGLPVTDSIWSKDFRVEDMKDAYKAGWNAAKAEKPDWSSDMEAAPKDGTLHLRGLWVHSAETGKPLYWQADAGGYDEGNFTGSNGDDFGWSAGDYTHWMPIPAPPKGETE